ncbi:MAG: tripartite tricarboxylate transporter substrate binding protein [Candidimonas sp.]
MTTGTRRYGLRWLCRAVCSVAVLGCLPALAAVHAQTTYPANPISLIVPFGTGGATDAIARIFAQGYADVAKWNVVVENKPGAGGAIGATFAARSAPDGYTWLLGTIGTQTANQFLYRSLGYDPESDFVPVALIGQISNLMVASPSLGAKTPKELLEKSRANPEGLSYSSSGQGTSGHLSVELLRVKTGLEAVHVPYKNAGQAHTDLVGGRIDFAIDNLPVLLPFVKSGKLVPLAITSLERSPLLPDVPTMQEAGIPDYQSASWFGLFLPKGTPQGIVDEIVSVSRKVLQEPALRQRLETQGVTIGDRFANDFNDFVKAERETMRSIIEQAGIEKQ